MMQDAYTWRQGKALKLRIFVFIHVTLQKIEPFVHKIFLRKYIELYNYHLQEPGQDQIKQGDPLMISIVLAS